ncbi:hypothetical protein NADFUDRAFT_45774 [Nadsonia fulvescens var. elongata DSM 6958]|uniref:uS12 prolyl 3,4-dihydroxylase n=1 Tax=Nadsonia fulvescens var. elongata DSM 6958 TaxID=857566 RepID=A0A1E3PLE0_9ASCO|nr:hypothetical protein NADFUDRAFT_45774 [Nadsonia fulvescens var. elongata DSM 6958]
MAKQLTSSADILASTKSIENVSSLFHSTVFEPNYEHQLRDEIANSEPYKHGVIPKLMDDKLLRKVRNEIMSELHFTKKETDIYKVFQTGDLANLSGLDQAELSRLSSLLTLRNGLYSKQFREFLSSVTGAGYLSGLKQDMSINVYHKGCHLMNHDDVIGTRRISYILYLPDPDQAWNPKWGGALRLFPTVKPNVPQSDYTVVIPPAWNQLAFFTVQPGHSFHDVEEVYFDKPRISISGWFHIPTEGEEGFIQGEKEDIEAKSSLHQLEHSEITEFDYPKINLYAAQPESDQTEQIESTLSEEETAYLARFMTPNLLDFDKIVPQLQESFLSASQVEISQFLNPEQAALVQNAINLQDTVPNKQLSHLAKDVILPWKLAAPSHKQHYMYMDGKSTYEQEDNLDIAPDYYNNKKGLKISETEDAFTALLEFFNSVAYQKWVHKLTSLVIIKSHVMARRFRPGQDFQLASGGDGNDSDEDDESITLEATLGLTPTKGWDDGEVGGYEIVMAIDDDADDNPEVYKGMKKSNSEENIEDKREEEGEEEGEEEEEEEEEEDPVLLSCQANWNTLNLYVRDNGILKFVKYISRSAPGSRWDISATWMAKFDGADEDDEMADD